MRAIYTETAQEVIARYSPTFDDDDEFRRNVVRACARAESLGLTFEAMTYIEGLERKIQELSKRLTQLGA